MHAILRCELPYWLIGGANRLDLPGGQQAPLALRSDELHILLPSSHLFARTLNMLICVLT
jgi:hypothetical protein